MFLPIWHLLAGKYPGPEVRVSITSPSSDGGGWLLSGATFPCHLFREHHHFQQEQYGGLSGGTHCSVTCHPATWKAFIYF